MPWSYPLKLLEGSVKITFRRKSAFDRYLKYGLIGIQKHIFCLLNSEKVFLRIERTAPDLITNAVDMPFREEGLFGNILYGYIGRIAIYHCIGYNVCQVTFCISVNLVYVIVLGNALAKR